MRQWGADQRFAGRALAFVLAAAAFFAAGGFFTAGGCLSAAFEIDSAILP